MLTSPGLHAVLHVLLHEIERLDARWECAVQSLLEDIVVEIAHYDGDQKLEVGFGKHSPIGQVFVVGQHLPEPGQLDSSFPGHVRNHVNGGTVVQDRDRKLICPLGHPVDQRFEILGVFVSFARQKADSRDGSCLLV